MTRTGALPYVVALAATCVLTLVGCGLRNLGESCVPGPVGDFLCAPTRCDEKASVCVECLKDIDCLRQDPWDRPKCMPGIPESEGGDGLPFCKHYADRGSCSLPGEALLCAPGKCAPDAGVCVDCLQDSDCPKAKPKCDPGVSPDFLPFCRAETAQ
jgi:hypothetical protein